MHIPFSQSRCLLLMTVIQCLTATSATLVIAQETLDQHKRADTHRGELPPVTTSASPVAGKQTRLTSAEYADTDVHHMLYLPADWRADFKDKAKTWPVIVEYTGNYFPAAGSTGRVEDARLGYGISGGKFIWVTLPFISEDRSENAITWWGDVTATVEYAKRNIPRICEEYGGNVDQILLCGFSRGAIAANFIGLHDDEIAKLWCGFITHDHYDGEREWGRTTWGSPLTSYRREAQQRLNRLNGRPVLISQQPSTENIQNYLRGRVKLNSFTFVNVNVHKILGQFPNKIAVHPHNDRWMGLDSPNRLQIWKWVDSVISPETPE